MSPAPALVERQSPHAEELYAEELAFLAAFDSGARPPGWMLTPRAVVTFVVGSGSEPLKFPREALAPEGAPRTLRISEKRQQTAESVAAPPA